MFCLIDNEETNKVITNIFFQVTTVIDYNVTFFFFTYFPVKPKFIRRINEK